MSEYLFIQKELPKCKIGGAFNVVRKILRAKLIYEHDNFHDRARKPDDFHSQTYNPSEHIKEKNINETNVELLKKIRKFRQFKRCVQYNNE